MAETANSIFGYTDKRTRRVEFCGTLVAVVAPTIGAMGAIIDATGAGVVDKNLVAAKLLKCFPDIAISCIREAANPRQHVFEDTPEARRMLADVPYDEAVKVLNVLVDLIGANPVVAEAEVKN